MFFAATTNLILDFRYFLFYNTINILNTHTYKYIKVLRWACLHLVANMAQYQVYTNSNLIFHFKKSTCITNKHAGYFIILLLIIVISMINTFLNLNTTTSRVEFSKISSVRILYFSSWHLKTKFVFIAVFFPSWHLHSVIV